MMLMRYFLVCLLATGAVCETIFLETEPFHTHDKPAKSKEDVNVSVTMPSPPNTPVVWKLNKKSLKESADVLFVSASVLTLIRPSIKMCGLYELYRNESGDKEVFVGQVALEASPVVTHQEIFNHLTELELKREGDSKVDVKRYEQGSIKRVEGDRVKLVCEVYGYPVPQLEWFEFADMNGERLALNSSGPNDERRPVVFNGGANWNKSTVLIKEIRSSDHSYYECEASSDLPIGKRRRVSVLMLLRVKSRLAWLWPLIGIFVVTIVLLLVIFGCECVQRKKAREQLLLNDDDEADEDD